MRTRAISVAILSAAMWMTVAYTGHALAESTAQPSPTATVEMLAETEATEGGDSLALYRIVLPPGANVDEHAHAGPAIWYIEAGTLTYTATEGAAWARCGGGCLREGSPVAATAAGDALPAGTSVTLETGDVVVLDAETSHAYRNDGDEPVVILVSSTADDTPADRCGGGCL